MVKPLDDLGFSALQRVEPETFERLRAYVALLEKWNRRINLVGPSTLADVWRRHILDSAQLFRLLPPSTRVLVDLGSGAGLPGLILGILGVPEVHLIEADARKSAFLLEAARVTGTAARVHAVRIEQAPVIAADVVTARALAPLNRLIDYARPFLLSGGSCYFLKGAQWAAELAEARGYPTMIVSSHPSESDGAGAILHVEYLGS